jgi:hypothetical protein
MAAALLTAHPLQVGHFSRRDAHGRGFVQTLSVRPADLLGGRRVPRPGASSGRGARLVHDLDRPPQSPEDVQNPVASGPVPAAHPKHHRRSGEPTLQLAPEHSDRFRGFQIALDERRFSRQDGVAWTRTGIDAHHEFLRGRTHEGAFDRRPQDRPIATASYHDHPRERDLPGLFGARQNYGDGGGNPITGKQTQSGDSPFSQRAGKVRVESRIPRYQRYRTASHWVSRRLNHAYTFPVRGGLSPMRRHRGRRNPLLP